MVTEASTGPRNRFREMIVAHGGGHGRGLPCSLLSGTLPSHGQAGQDSDEGAAMYTEEMCMLHAVIMLYFCTNFNDSAPRERPSTEVL